MFMLNKISESESESVTNINKTRLVNMVIFRDFKFRDYVIKTNITIKFSRITDFSD